MSHFRSLGGVFTSPPAVVPWGNVDRFLFVFAVGTDQALWYTQLDGLTSDEGDGTWSEWRSLGGVVTSPPHAVRSAESWVDVFAVGAYSELLHWQFRDGAWTNWPVDPTNTGEVAFTPGPVLGGFERNWESLGGVLVSPPHAVMLGEANDILGVLVRGSDHALWIRSSVEGAWRDWDTLGHTLRSPPHPVTWRRQTLAVFAVGTDSAIWYTMGSDWHSLGGRFASAPYAVATRNHIHVFAADEDSALRHCSWDGSTWTGWESLGGTLMSRPTANGFDAGELVHVFALGTDSAIWRRRWLGDSWSDWHSLGGPFISPPSTITRIPFDAILETRDLAALRTDHAVWHMEEGD
jgi:hypothetical protein